MLLYCLTNFNLWNRIERPRQSFKKLSGLSLLSADRILLICRGVCWVISPIRISHIMSWSFFNEAHLWCMKNEAAFGYEALLRNTKNEKRALRFMAWARRFIEAIRLLLHIRIANASFIRPQFPAKPCNLPIFMLY